MANETELESIIVRLLGDGSSYQKMLTQAAESTQRTEAIVQQSAKKIEQFQTSLKGFAEQAVGVLGALGVAASLNSAFVAFSDLEKSQIRLKATLQATGKDVETTTARYVALATQMAETTLVSKGETMQLLQRATMMGLNVEQAEKVARVSISLAGITGQSAEGMLRAAAAMERGNMQLASRMILGRGVKLSEEELAKVLQGAVTGGMAAQIEMAKTASGRLELLGRSLKFVTVEIGGMVATAIKPAVAFLQELITQFKALDPAIKQMITFATGGALAWKYYGTAIAAVMPVITPLITGLKALWASMLGPWGLVAVGVGLVVTKLGGFAAAWAAVKEAALAAWEYIKEKATAFLEWLQPIWLALKGAAVAVWSVIGDTAGRVWDGIKGVVFMVWDGMKRFYTWLTGNTTTTWADVQRAVTIALIACEFGVQRFGDVWRTVINGAATRLLNLQRDMADFFGNQDAVNRINAMLDNLVAENDAALRRMDETWAQFRDRRLREIADQLTAQQRARNEDTNNAADHVDRQIKKEKEKHDAVLRFSAQALASLTSYRETFQRREDDTTNRVEGPDRGGFEGGRPLFGRGRARRPQLAGEGGNGGLFGPVFAAGAAENQLLVARIAELLDPARLEAERAQIRAERGQFQPGLGGREGVVNEQQRNAILEQLRVQQQMRDALNRLNFEGANLQ